MFSNISALSKMQRPKPEKKNDMELVERHVPMLSLYISVYLGPGVNSSFFRGEDHILAATWRFVAIDNGKSIINVIIIIIPCHVVQHPIQMLHMLHLAERGGGSKNILTNEELRN